MNQFEQPPTIKDIRLRHGLTAQQVADTARVPLRVEYMMEIGCPVSQDDAKKITRALSALVNGYSKPTNFSQPSR